jgi:hypothetical protein
LDDKIGALYSPISGTERLVVYSGLELQAGLPGVFALSDGCYYSTIRFGASGMRYSEMFRVSNDRLTPAGTIYNVMRWGNSFDFGGMPYSTGYKNILYMESEIAVNAVLQTEEGLEDDAKNFIPTLEKTHTQYVVREYVPAAVAEALGHLKMHDSIEFGVVSDFGLYTDFKTMHRVETQIDYDLDRCNALVTITFFLDDGVIKTACENKVVTTEDPEYAPSEIIALQADCIGNTGGTWSALASVQAPYNVTYVEVTGLPFNGGLPIQRYPVTNAVSISDATAGMGTLAVGVYALTFTPVRVKNNFVTKGAAQSVVLTIPA